MFLKKMTTKYTAHYSEQIDKLSKAITDADAIVIGPCTLFMGRGREHGTSAAA